jgi:DNA polymerase III delta subunit
MATQADLEALLEAAKAGRMKPLVLIYGDQDYLVKQAYDRLLDALVPADLRSFNLEQLDGTRVELGQVLDSFNTLPMLPGPKAVGLVDARFFQSKANTPELLQKAKDRWLAGEPAPALRQLARVISLAEWGWAEGAAASDDQWVEALDLNAAEFGRLSLDWLRPALAQALASDFPLPPSADESGQFAEGIEASLAAGGEGLYLVCAAASADARKRLYKLFHEKGHVLDFKNDTRGAQLDMTARAFLSMALKQRALVAKGGLGPRLAAAYGSDLGLLQRELDKLEAYAYPRKELEESDLRAVGTPVAEDDVFELLGALGNRDLGQALKVLQRQLGIKDASAFALFGLLCSEMRKLAVMRALMDEGRLPSKGASNFQAFKANTYPALAKTLPTGLAQLWKKTNPYPLHQSLERARSFSAAQLHGLSLQLAQMDLEMKNGGISASDALEEIVLRFCGVQEEAIL